MGHRVYNALRFGNNIGVIQINNPLNREGKNDVERMFDIFSQEGFDMFNRRTCKKLHVFLNLNDRGEWYMDRGQIIRDLFSGFMNNATNKLVLHINKSVTVDYNILMSEINKQFQIAPSLKKYIKIDTGKYTLFASGVYYYYYRTGSTKLPGLYAKIIVSKDDKKYDKKVIWIGGESYVRI